MSDFATYYRTKFSSDIIQFFTTIPDSSKFHFCLIEKIFKIQYYRLNRDYEHLNFLSTTDKEFFGVALFFTVLTDMVCYSCFHQYYDQFRKLTQYPKFIGNCHSECHNHLEPKYIFEAMNYSREGCPPVRLEFAEKFKEAIPVMEEEVKDFFPKHLPEIDGQEFWDRYKREFPDFDRFY